MRRPGARDRESIPGPSPAVEARAARGARTERTLGAPRCAAPRSACEGGATKRCDADRPPRGQERIGSLSLRGLAGAALAVAAFGGAAVFPSELGELPGRLASVHAAPLREPGPAGFVERLDTRLLARFFPLDRGERRLLARTIVAEAEAARIDPLLVLALIEVESAWDPEALSGRGARGLMQLREPTLRREVERSGLLLEDLHDPVVNVQAGVRYLRRLLDAFGREEVALMAYNAGPNRILGYLREGEIPARFHVYPRRVKAELRRLRRSMGGEARTVLAEARLPSLPQ